MVLYTPTNQIFNNRLDCKKTLKINNPQYLKLVELNILIPINKEDTNLNRK